MDRLTDPETPEAAEPAERTSLAAEAATPPAAAEPAIAGRPETLAGYDFSPGETATGYDTALADWFRGTAHELGLPAELAVALHDRFRDRMAEASADAWRATGGRQAATEAVLRQDWGRGYEARLADALRAVDRFGGAALKAALDASDAGNDPAVIRAFAEIGRRLAGDGGAGSGATDEGPATPTAAQRAILRLRADDKFMAAYGDRSHPGHDVAQAQMDELYARAYPAGGAR